MRTPRNCSTKPGWYLSSVPSSRTTLCELDRLKLSFARETNKELANSTCDCTASSDDATTFVSRHVTPALEDVPEKLPHQHLSSQPDSIPHLHPHWNNNKTTPPQNLQPGVRIGDDSAPESASTKPGRTDIGVKWSPPIKTRSCPMWRRPRLSTHQSSKNRVTVSLLHSRFPRTWTIATGRYLSIPSRVTQEEPTSNCCRPSLSSCDIFGKEPCNLSRLRLDVTAVTTIIIWPNKFACCLVSSAMSEGEEREVLKQTTIYNASLHHHAKFHKCHFKVDAVSAFNLVKGYNTFSCVQRTNVVHSCLERCP